MSGVSDTADRTTVPTDAEIPVRSMGSVSLRDIGNGEPNWNSDALSDLAKARGIDREFAFRELVTSQVYSSRQTWKVDWDNWLDDREAKNVSRFRPTDADEVRQVLLSSVDDGGGGRQTVRAVGAGHSHSRAARPEEAFVELSWYDGSGVNGLVDKLPAQWQKSNKKNVPHFNPNEEDATRLGAGNPLKYLNRKVLKDDNQALLNMGSYDAQTLAGAVNTGTHGTGKDLGTLADSVLSVELLTVMESPADETEPLVRKFRIEPEDGITHRDAFEDAVGNHGMTLIQNDTIFYSAVVGYGGMGIATAYTLRVADQKFYLKEHTDVRKWSNLKGNIFSDYLNKSHIRQTQFLVNLQAAQDPTTDPFCLIRYYTKESWQPNPPERKGQGIFRWLRQKITKGGIDPLSSNPFLAVILNRIYFKKNQTGPQFDGKKSKTASYIALRRTRDKNHSDPASPPSDPTLGMSTELAVPIGKVEKAVDGILNQVRGVYVDGKKVRFAGPMGVRFVDSGPHKFTPEFKKPDRPDAVAMVEVPFSVEPVRAVANLVAGAVSLLLLAGPIGLAAIIIISNQLLPSRDISQKRMVEISKKALSDIEWEVAPYGPNTNLNGRPHMGKFNNIGESNRNRNDTLEITDLYPKDEFEKWHGVYKQFNAFGTFNNSFLKKLDLNVKRDSKGAYTTWGRSN